MDWPRVYPPLLFMALQCTSRACIWPYALWVVNGPADSLSSNMIRQSIIMGPTSGPNIWLVNRWCTSWRIVHEVTTMPIQAIHWKPSARAHWFVQSIHRHLTTSLPTRSLHLTEINIPHTGATHCFSPSSLVLGIIDATQLFHTSLWNGVDWASRLPIGQEVPRYIMEWFHTHPAIPCHPNPTSCGLWTSSEDTCHSI